LCVSAAYRNFLLKAPPDDSFDMAPRASRNQVGDEATQEFLRWVQELKKVRDEFEALLDEYEGKRQRLVQAIKE
jgi:hypothetical protein